MYPLTLRTFSQDQSTYRANRTPVLRFNLNYLPPCMANAAVPVIAAAKDLADLPRHLRQLLSSFLPIAVLARTLFCSKLWGQRFYASAKRIFLHCPRNTRNIVQQHMLKMYNYIPFVGRSPEDIVLRKKYRCVYIYLRIIDRQIFIQPVLQ